MYFRNPSVRGYTAPEHFPLYMLQTEKCNVSQSETVSDSTENGERHGTISIVFNAV